jgi:hypothetical protein
MICGMVSDGTWSGFDILYIFATNTYTTAQLNLISTSYGLGVTTGTFTADRGITGIGSGDITTSWVPSTNAVNYTQNSASVGTCVLNSRAAAGVSEFGSSNGSNNYNYFQPYTSTGVTAAINNAAITSGLSGPGTSQGDWILSRTASTGFVVYHNAAAVGTVTEASTTLSTLQYFILATNQNSAAAQPTSDQLGYFFAAAGLTSGQVTLVNSRLSTYMTTVGASGC